VTFILNHTDTCIAQVCYVSASDSPLGHLTSTFSQIRLALAFYALVMGLGLKSHWDTPVGRARPEQLLLRVFDRAQVVPSPTAIPARHVLVNTNLKPHGRGGAVGGVLRRTWTPISVRP
jgi:hypothetical protein